MESDFPLFQTITFYWAFPSVLGYNQIMFGVVQKHLSDCWCVAQTIKSGLDFHTSGGYTTHWTMRLTLQDMWPFTIHASWQRRLVAQERCGISATLSVCWTAVFPPKGWEYVFVHITHNSSSQPNSSEPFRLILLIYL